MSSSPYLSYTGYSPRTYGRSNSSSGVDSLYGGGKYSSRDTSGTGITTTNSPSSYYRSKYIIPEDGPAKSYLAPKYKPAFISSYQLSRYNSSDNVPDTSHLSDYNKLKKSTSTASFLTGSIPTLHKSYNTGENASHQFPFNPVTSKYTDISLHSPVETKPFASKNPEGRKYAGKYGGESSYASAYLARINKGRERPREIDTRDINVTDKPTAAKWLKPDRGREEEGSISRNRKVVRLTIKREKTESQDPFTIKNKTLQTIAQRLIDKYQVPEKKQEPEALYRRKFYQGLSSPKDEKPPMFPLDRISKPPIASPRPVPEIAVPTLQTPSATQITSKDPAQTLRTPRRLISSNDENVDDAAVVLQRATITAETKDNLESWQEVKDAIYAAVLHPDVDIESDEEIGKLIKGDIESPDGSKKDTEDSECRCVAMGKGKGNAILGQLKKFVKQQESTNRSRKKLSKKVSRGSKGSKKSKEGRSGTKEDLCEVTEKEIMTERDNPYIRTSNHLVQEAYDKTQKEEVKEPSSVHDCATADSKTQRAEEAHTELKPKSTTTVDKKFEEIEQLTTTIKATRKEKGSLLSPDLVLKTITPKNKVTKDIKDETEFESKESAAGGDGSKTLHHEKDKVKDPHISKTKRAGERSLLSADLVLYDLSLENKSHAGEEYNATRKQHEINYGKLPQAVECEKMLCASENKDKTKDTQSTKIPKIKQKIKKTTAVEDATPEVLHQSASPGTPPSDPPPLLSQSSASPPQVSKSTSHLESLDTQETKVKCRAPAVGEPTPASDKQINSNKTPNTKQFTRQKVAITDLGDKTSQTSKGLSGIDTSPELGTSKAPSASCLTQEHKNERAVKVESSERLGVANKGPETTKLSSLAPRHQRRENMIEQPGEAPKLDKLEAKQIDKEMNKETAIRKQESVGNNAVHIHNETDKSSRVAKPSGIPRRKEGCKVELKEELKNVGVGKGKDDKEYYTKTIQPNNNTNKARDNEKEKDKKECYTKTAINITLKTKLKSSTVPDDTKNEEQVTDKEESASKTAKDIFTTNKDKVGHCTVDKEQRTNESSNKPEVDNRMDKKTNIIKTTNGDLGKETRNDDVSKVRGNREKQIKEDKILKGTGCENLNESEAGRDARPPSDISPVKKALKRPRQVAPPPAQKEDITIELMKARNILKRPIKQNTTTATTDNSKQEQANTAEAMTKTPWRKPIAQLVSSNQGDQFLQARNILKRPVKPKEEIKPVEEVVIEKVSDVKVKQLVKKAAPSVQAETAGDEVSQETRGRALRKQLHTRSRSISSSSSDSDEYEGSTVRKKVEKSRRPLKAKPADTVKTTSPKLFPRGSQEEKNLSGISSAPTPQAPGSIPKSGICKSAVPEITDQVKEPVVEVLPQSSDGEKKDSERSAELPGQEEKVSVSQSADSGYGSSPSTPQPTSAAADTKPEERCTVCGTNCHKKCEKQMPNLCGVNQKLLAEALSSVKKGGTTDGTTRTLAASPIKTTSSSISGSETETTEDETDTTDTDNEYFGLPEIRPPLQTCPKFKKYSLEDFNFIKVLGKGSYGKVMLAQQKDSENYFAVKCLKKDVVLEDNDVECTLIERKVLSLGTKHPYLCHLFCTFQTPSHLFFVMEYLTGGDLMFHIQHVGRFDEFRACFYAAEITSGLKFLHSKGIIYRDLKLDNILLDYQGHIRIADFGMCKLQVYLDRFADTFCGTPDYMAPEVIKGQHYNQCVDWWSFGVLLYEMLTGKSPFKGCDEDHLFWLICNDEPFFPKFLSKEASNILKQLLDKDSTRRLGIPFSPYGEITVHPFFSYIDWQKIERKEVETPYKPRLRHILDVQYFDPLFTKRHAAITPLDESILTTMDQTPFKEFSYTNPNITD